MKVIFGNNLSGSLLDDVIPADNQIEVTQAFWESLPTFVEDEEFITVTLSDPNNVSTNPKYETLQVTSKTSGSGQYFLHVDTDDGRDWDNDNSGVGGTFAASTATISMRLTSKHLNEVFLKQDDDATPLATGDRLVISSNGGVSDDPIQMQLAYSATETGGGTGPFVVLTGIDMADAMSDYYREFVYVNGIRQIEGIDYTISFDATDTVLTMARSVYANNKLRIETYKGA